MKALVQLILNATAAGKSWLLAADAAAQKALLSLTKSDVGLGNVDNTSDVNKPVSTAQAAAIAGKANSSHTHAQSDVTGLVSALAAKADLVAGLVPSSQLPSYVDDVIEGANLAAFPATGETGKIYVALDTGKTYRWSGSAYVELTDATAVWGSISGTLSNQTDLSAALNAKIGGSVGSITNRLVKASGTGGSTVQSTGITVDASNNVSGMGTLASGAITSGVAGASNGQITVASSASVNAFITIGGTVSSVVSGANNALGTTWLAITDTTGSGGPAAIRIGSTGTFGFGNTAANVGTVDTVLGRASANTLGVYTSEARSTLGNVSAGAITASGTVISTPTAIATSGMAFGIVENSVEKFGYRAGAGLTGELVVQASAPHTQTIILRPRSSVSGTSVLLTNNGLTLRNSLDSADATLTAGAITASGLMCAGVYTFATVPSASSNSGKFLRISDRSQKHAYSDGTNWRFFGDDAIIS